MAKDKSNKKITKVDIVTKNFELIMDLMKLHKSSLEKSYFLLFFCFSILYISNLRTYRDLLIKSYKIDSTLN